MKEYILLLFSFFMFSICFGQKHIGQGDIQICYRKSSSVVGGQDHCVTIRFDDNSIFVQRICYKSMANVGGLPLTDFKSYDKAKKQAILNHYQNSDDFLILDERVEISNSQFDEFVKVINEIRAFGSEVEGSVDEIIIRTGGFDHYMIKNNNEAVIIIDWIGIVNRGRDIEKALGLQSFLRCPCVEAGLKQMNNGKK